jgi:hypothetical protein
MQNYDGENCFTENGVIFPHVALLLKGAISDSLSSFLITQLQINKTARKLKLSEGIVWL